MYTSTAGPLMHVHESPCVTCPAYTYLGLIWVVAHPCTTSHSELQVVDVHAGWLPGSTILHANNIKRKPYKDGQTKQGLDLT